MSQANKSRSGFFASFRGRKANQTKAPVETEQVVEKEPEPPMAPKVAIIFYSTWGHIRQMADEVAKGLEKGGAQVTMFQVPETLPEDVLKKQHAMPKDKNIAVITAEDLVNFDAFIFGIPTRYGMAAAQMKSFWDTTGAQWATQALSGKCAGIFFSTATQGGGQETTALTWITQLTHHGITFVPLGYTHPGLLDMKEIHGGSPYGPGTLAGPDGSRQPSALERDIAVAYGVRFAGIAAKLAAK